MLRDAVASRDPEGLRKVLQSRRCSDFEVFGTLKPEARSYPNRHLGGMRDVVADPVRLAGLQLPKVRHCA